jgi:hypothetical protein
VKEIRGGERERERDRDRETERDVTEEQKLREIAIIYHPFIIIHLIHLFFFIFSVASFNLLGASPYHLEQRHSTRWPGDPDC